MGLCCAGGVSGAEGSGFCMAPVSAGAAVGFLRSAGVGPVLLVHSSWAGRAAFLHPERSAALWRMGGGERRQRRVVLCSVPIELRTQPHWLHRGAVLGCPLHLRPSCPREKTQPAALQIPGWLCVAVPLPVRRGGGGELPHSAPQGGWVSADPLSRPLPPLQAVAAVCGFLIVILLCLICFFAQKTRSKIWRYGKANIYWDRAPVVQEGPDVEEWVSAGGGQWERPPPTLSRLGVGDVAVTPRLCPIARSSSCHKQRCLRSAALHQELLLLLLPAAVGLSSLPTTPFFPLSLKGKQGWIRWAGGQQC